MFARRQGGGEATGPRASADHVQRRLPRAHGAAAAEGPKAKPPTTATRPEWARHTKGVGFELMKKMGFTDA